MPSKSDKQLMKELVVSLIGWQITVGRYQPEIVIFTMQDLTELLELLNIYRYMETRTPVPKSIHWLETVLPSSDFGSRRFRQHMRMDRSSFIRVLELICDSEQFKDTQHPIPVQLAVALQHLGTFGNSSSFGQIATKFGTSDGSVENFTHRVVQALIGITQTWIKWPEAQERRDIGSKMACSYFPNCIGFVDGTDATLYQAPKEDKQTYWSRKKRYGIQFQVVCDPERKIRHVFTGYPASVHDAKVYSVSAVSTQPHAHFSNGEYLLGDSAYPNSTYLIAPFRKRAGILRPAHRNFNKQHSGQRVAVEHTIGILKGRFQCLQGLRINVGKDGGHEKCCQWIVGCCTLHNILMSTDPWTQDGDVLYDEDDDDDFDYDQNGPQSHTGEEKRAALSAMVNTMCT